MRKMRCFFTLFLLLSMFLLTSCSDLTNGKGTGTVFVPPITQTTAAATTKAPAKTTELTSANTTAAATTISSTRATTQKTSKVTTKAPATNAPPETTQDDANITVYVTSTGTKYHCDGCRYLKDSQIAMPLSEAKLKYGPCSVCNPPT